MRRNTLIATAIIGAIATIVGLAGLSVGAVSAMNGNAADGTTRAGSSCTPPRPEGAIVNVSLRNAGGSMMGGNTTMMGNDARRPSEGGGHMQGNGQGMMSGNGNGMMPSGEMSLIIDRSSVHSGKVSFVATNDGSITHELVVLPLAESKAAGNSPMSTENKIDETDSLGEASATCAAGAGSGIASGTAGWVTLTLAPGRYEVVCNLPGHYVAGMYRELTVI